MNYQLQLILRRLKRPAVLVSLISQVLTILMLLNVRVNMTIVSGVLTALISILALLGILSNPDTKSPGYGDDFAVCPNCQKKTHHVAVGESLVCEECGGVTVTSPESPASLEK